MKRKIALTCFLIIAAGIIGNYLRYVGRKPSRIADFSLLPLQMGEYVGEEIFFHESTYDVLQATTTTMRKYRTAEGLQCDLFIAYFQSQKFGSGIHSPKHCVPGGGWRILDIQPSSLRLDETVVKDVNRLTIALGEEERLMLYWFETRSGSIRNEYGLKFALIKSALAMKPTDAAIVRVTVPILHGNVDEAVSRSTDFCRSLYPSVKNALPF